jgi:hypothetical protein
MEQDGLREMKAGDITYKIQEQLNMPRLDNETIMTDCLSDFYRAQGADNEQALISVERLCRFMKQWRKERSVIQKKLTVSKSQS